MEHIPDTHPAFLTDEERALSRRSFLRFMGAGALLAGMSLPACRRIERYLVPYHNAPEWTIPGLPTFYATCMPGALDPIPLLAVCQEGRPTKLDPAVQIPSPAGLATIPQSSLLGLYDPNRSRNILFKGQLANTHEWEGAFRSWAKKTINDGKVAFIFSEGNSPVRTSLIEDIRRRNPNALFFSWDPLSKRPMRQAVEAATNSGAQQSIRWAKTSRILAIDCDFLGSEPLGNTREFMKNRLPEGNDYRAKLSQEEQRNRLNRLYVAEARLSLTGGIADHRLPLDPLDIPLFIKELAIHIGTLVNDSSLADLPPSTDHLTNAQTRWIEICARDLVAHLGQSLIVLGGSYPEALHRLVLSINTALKATGVSLLLLNGKKDTLQPLADLPAAIQRNAIDTLFVLCESNPTCDTPAQLDIKNILQSKKIESIHLGLYVNETALSCDWHIPAAHYLESWGLEQNTEGVYLYRQPIVLPLYGGFSELEILSALLHTKGLLLSSDSAPNKLSPVYHRVRKCFEKAIKPASKDTAWDDALRRGFSRETAFTPINSRPKPLDQSNINAIYQLIRQNTEQKEINKNNANITIQCVCDYSVMDGRFAPNAWLQECPDPITGLCWDAPAQCSPKTAANLMGHEVPPKSLLEIAQPEAKLEAKPLQFVLSLIPGMPDNVIVLPLGYGTFNPLFEQPNNHQVKDDIELNANAYALGHSGNPLPLSIAKTRLRILTNHAHPVAQFIPMQNGATPWSEEQATKPQAQSKQNTQPNSPEHSMQNQWGMTIDLNLCIGCNACIIACMAENNIPVVGRQEIINGRIMQWIRIDRYLLTTDKNTSIIPHPVACQQCENAPCESVCPVNATVHTSEGLNAMVYARCWGTRYCATNCPYKTRHFNFFDYAKQSESTTQHQPNPNVTVRSRGVMEKCTYCVQKIEQAKIRHKALLMQSLQKGASKSSPAHDAPPLTDAELRLPDGAVQTACQLACPAGAIRFGNLLDPHATVIAAKKSPRQFKWLNNIGTEPRTSYLKRQGNPNLEI
ncbi:MAG: 4Fe-4S dicluster domain-containing protein [Akkermansia sp.]